MVFGLVSKKAEIEQDIAKVVLLGEELRILLDLGKELDYSYLKVSDIKLIRDRLIVVGRDKRIGLRTLLNEISKIILEISTKLDRLIGKKLVSLTKVKGQAVTANNLLLRFNDSLEKFNSLVGLPDTATDEDMVRAIELLFSMRSLMEEARDKCSVTDLSN